MKQLFQISLWDVFLNKEHKKNPETLYRARVLFGLYILVLLVGAPSGLIARIPSEGPLYPVFIEIIGSVIGLILLKRVSRLTYPAINFIIFGTISILFLAFSNGIFYKSSLTILLVMVVATFFIGGRRIGLLYSLFVIIIIIFLPPYIENMAPPFAGDAFVKLNNSLQFNLLVLFVWLAIFSYFYEDSKQRLLRQLDKNKELMIEQEKMASLGQLTAGVAHEINNPINFISGNAQALEMDFKDLEEWQNKYYSLNTNISKQVNENPDQVRTSIVLSETINEMKSLVDGIKNGSKRVADIVKGLQVFNYSVNDTFTKVAIEELVENALVILQNKINLKEIEIVRSYGIIPMVNGHPSRLVQAFVNILDNAIDAVDNRGRIKIKSTLENESVIIDIEDNGRGMSSETLNRIFDPFFTTKEVGQGTGLGMAITYGIIKSHQGAISISSEPGWTSVKITFQVE